MKRKVIKQGLGGFTIYLPKKWVNFVELKAGDELDVKENGKTLIIEADKSTVLEDRQVEINLDSVKRNFDKRSLLGALYKLGYDTIILNYNELDMKVVKEISSDLYGFEILKLETNYCVFKNIIQTTNVNLDESYRKIIFSIKQIQTQIIKNIENDSHSLDTIEVYRKNILKLRDLIMRIISKEKLVDPKNMALYSIVSELWLITKRYISIQKYLINEVLENQKMFVGELRKMNILVNNIFTNKIQSEDVSKNRKIGSLLEKELYENIMNSKSDIILYNYLALITFVAKNCLSFRYMVTHDE